MTTHDNSVQCTRCRNKHKKSDRHDSQGRNGVYRSLCPRCGGRSYYDLEPKAAWCWATGLIEFGDECDLPEGAILIARGPLSFLSPVVGVVARHGRENGVLLVPGIPEADSQADAASALDEWLASAATRNGTAGSYGVTFIMPPGD